MSNDAVIGSIFVILAAAVLVVLTSCGGDGPEAFDCEKHSAKKENTDTRNPCGHAESPTPLPTSEEIRAGKCRAICNYIDADTCVPALECDP